ncbi:hypothetical protein [Nocardioides sediminis]|uniref:hypothetical protein n=1 Tax=Nocardioides sediminis TaxID=433648 RepID=UPI00131F3BF0|nr:hypothetical protein [Nocardioides sediminis]
MPVVLVAGCSEPGDGFADLGEREMERVVVRDMKALESVRLTGASTRGRDKLSMDLILTSRGDCSGEITMSRATFSYRTVDGTTYVRGDRAFWQDNAGSAQAAQQVVSTIGDKWAVLPRSAPGFGTLCDIDDFMREFRSDRRATGADKEVTTVGEVGEVEGVDAVEVITKKRQETTVTWVALESPHVVLRVESAGGEAPGSFRMSDHDEDVTLTAPPRDQVVDLDRL